MGLFWLENGSKKNDYRWILIYLLETQQSTSQPATIHCAHHKTTTVESAWLLDEERVRDVPEEVRNDNKLDNALRLPPTLKSVLEVIEGSDQGKVFHCYTRKHQHWKKNRRSASDR